MNGIFRVRAGDARRVLDGTNVQQTRRMLTVSLLPGYLLSLYMPEMPESKPPEEKPGRRRGVSPQFSATVLAVALVLYVLSMVPVGRLYMGSYLEEKTAHEYWLSQLYLPLLYVTTRNEFGYNCTLAYSNWWSALIPSTQTRMKSGFKYDVYKNSKIINGGVLSPSYPKSWWFQKRIRYTLDLYKYALGSKAPSHEIARLGRNISEVPEDE
ncbi:MAG TPA: hypothetical protein VK970_15705 [Candidatus Methylacidiphilales bacterium]|nr:hypothetical protein [Candidatus Methylacidiphilales bacterium]